MEYVKCYKCSAEIRLNKMQEECRCRLKSVSPMPTYLVASNIESFQTFKTLEYGTTDTIVLVWATFGDDYRMFYLGIYGEELECTTFRSLLESAYDSVDNSHKAYIDNN